MQRLWRVLTVLTLAYLLTVVVVAQGAIQRLQEDNQVQWQRIDTNIANLNAINARLDAIDRLNIEKRMTVVETNSATQMNLFYGIAVGICLQLFAFIMAFFKKEGHQSTVVTRTITEVK